MYLLYLVIISLQLMEAFINMSDPNEECPSALHRQVFVVNLSHLVQAVIQ